MKRTRRRFTPEFKEEALRLLEASGGRTVDVSKQLGIHPVLLNKWRQIRENPDPVRAPKAQAQGLQSPADKDAELAQLRRENARLKMEHEILKKTLGILSEIQK